MMIDMIQSINTANWWHKIKRKGDLIHNAVVDWDEKISTW